MRILSLFLFQLCCVSFVIAQQTFLPAQKKYDIPYGSFASSKMDLYLPVNRTPATPFVIIIHGGGWVAGDKQGDRGSQQILLEQGIASANINYRFADSLGTHYEQLLADIDSAVAYCMQHATVWNTRKTNFVLMGASAGGHLSLLYSYTTNRKVSAIIAECAPADLTDTTTLHYEASIGLLPLIFKIAGATYTPGGSIDKRFFAVSPIHHVKHIPTLIIHGTGDKVVPFWQAEKLQQKLAAEKITHQLLPIQGADHDLGMRDIPTREMIYAAITEWIWKHGSR
ncbi:MAG: alpha/beta hydrolase [Chitinophagaceae bacterium]|nr:alpha/beta hydrolase [Chitinophagaceae bacterium]